jgi:hypothetical protein
MNQLKALVILISLFSVIIFLVWYFNQKAKSKDRLLIIEKGIDPKDLDFLIEKTPPPQWLKIGIIVVGIAIGTLVATLYTHAAVQLRLPFFYGSTVGIILLFAGLSMILANFVGNSKK